MDSHVEKERGTPTLCMGIGRVPPPLFACELGATWEWFTFPTHPSHPCFNLHAKGAGEQGPCRNGKGLPPFLPLLPLVYKGNMQVVGCMPTWKWHPPPSTCVQG